MKLIIPDIPPSLNDWARKWHWAKVNKVKQKWSEDIGWLVLEQGKPAQPLEKAEVRLTFYFPDKRRRDPDNYGAKFINDGLVEAGVLVDDSTQHVEIVKRFRVDRDNPRTEVEIVEVGA